MAGMATADCATIAGMSTSQYRVAVLGATGLVGGKIIEILEERNFPVSELLPLASGRSAGKTIRFRGKVLTVQEALPPVFEGCDLVLASAGAKASEVLAPYAVKAGAVVVDNTSFFRMQPDVPLVVAGVNDHALKNHQGIVANPNCSTMQLMPVLKALHEAAGLERVIVSTYQSVSGAGQKGLEALALEGQQLSANPDAERNARQASDAFARPIAENLIPQIDVFLSDDCKPGFEGYTKEEAKLIEESRKILELPHLRVTATAVRVPVRTAHSEAVTVELSRPLSPQAAIQALKAVPDLIVADSPADFPTPLDAAGQDPVYVGRIRQDTSHPERGLNLWVVADNLRIGAALNAVRLAEALVRDNLLRQPAQADACSL